MWEHSGVKKSEFRGQTFNVKKHGKIFKDNILH